MQEIQKLMKKIEADPQNTEYTKAGIQPLFSAPRCAKILIVGQAPGIKAQESRLFWNDKSGDNLRTWMGVTRDFFYQSDLFAVVPMDYYYPGKGKSGDLPPRKGFAEKWHEKIHCSSIERQWFKNLLDLGLTDSLRQIHPEGAFYTWFDYRGAMFQRKLGLRIDHQLISPALSAVLKDVYVDLDARAQERPSDHAPVVAEFDL